MISKWLTKENILSWLMLTAGAVLAAFALEEFLVPNNVFDGGVTGISMISAAFIPLNISHLIVIINLPFLIYGFLKMGRAFIGRVLYAVVLFAVMTDVFAPLQNATRDVFLGIIFGGIFLGAGVGMVLRGGGCLDGTEIVAIQLSRRTSLSTGQIILAFNVVIYVIAGFLFGLDHGMYSLIMYFLTSKVIDIVEIGWDNAKSVMIITGNGPDIAEEIYRKLGRTVTFLKGDGYVSRDKKDVLYCVVTRAEIRDLKAIIASDPGSSFTTISEVTEIIGRHIKAGHEK